MARRILVLLLTSSVAAMYPRAVGPVVRGGDSRPALSNAAVAAGDEDAVCGEPRQAGPEGEGCRQQPAVPDRALPHETCPARGALADSPARGLAPILASLSDSLILSRPPPAGSGRT